MRFFDFFAGIGGFRLGMEMAGHQCVGHFGGVLDVAISDTRRGRVINNGKTTNTLDALCRIGLNVDDVRIRKLTPKECFRLQGFPDEYFDRAAEVCSDSQLYKQAGNSVTVNVIYEIAKRLEAEK